MDALERAMLAQARRMPGGGAGNVGDALKWFDEPHPYERRPHRVGEHVVYS